MIDEEILMRTITILENKIFLIRWFGKDELDGKDVPILQNAVVALRRQLKEDFDDSGIYN